MEWKKLREKRVYEGFRHINRKRFLLPDGIEAEFDIVDAKDTVGILALTPENTVILARQFRPGIEKMMDDMPGGEVDKGETPLQAAERELLEETGYCGTLVPVGSCTVDAYFSGKRYSFIATNCRKIKNQELDHKEFIEVVLKPLPEFIQQVREGKLTGVELAYMALDKLGWLTD